MTEFDRYRFEHEGIAPIPFEWNGEAMVPLRAYQARCNKQYVVHERYMLAPQAERSDATHSHYFACIAEGHRQLPDHHRVRFPTPEHLRKWSLVKSGYCHQRQIVCESEEKARELVGFVAPLDEYAIVIQTGPIVTVYTAKSQSRSAMKGKNEFQDSKEKVLETIADILGISVEALTANAGRAA